MNASNWQPKKKQTTLSFEPVAKKSKKACKYGENCYRTGADHAAKYYHPTKANITPVVSEEQKVTVVHVAEIETSAVQEVVDGSVQVFMHRETLASFSDSVHVGTASSDQESIDDGEETDPFDDDEPPTTTTTAAAAAAVELEASSPPPCLAHEPEPAPAPPADGDAWNCYYVQLPCSKHNVYNSATGAKLSKWYLIQSVLQEKILSASDLEAVILEYNQPHVGKWDFTGLHHFFRSVLNEDEARNILTRVIPAMQKLATDLPNVMKQPIPILRPGCEDAVMLTQRQIASLLANMFFCTIPHRSRTQHVDTGTLPSASFHMLFSGDALDNIPSKQAQKLRAFFHYFDRVTTNMPDGCVTFRRQVLRQAPVWDQVSCTLCEVTIKDQGTIEDDAVGALQVDFANKLVGGGVLGHGCVQEEIRFTICPELVAARLFTAELQENECLVMVGAERFSSYSGYADTFQFTGDYVDHTPRDSSNRRKTHIVAIDALHFRKSLVHTQYSRRNMLRELNKAYIGFCSPQGAVSAQPVATGNWGCGVFNGDPLLKFLLQWLAASFARRPMLYFTYGEPGLATQIQDIMIVINAKKPSVGQVWRGLNECADSVMRSVELQTPVNMADAVREYFTRHDETR